MSLFQLCQNRPTYTINETERPSAKFQVRYIYKYTFHIYMSTYIYIYVCLHVYLYIHICMYWYICMYVYVCICIYIYICIYMYIYIYKHIYIYVYIQRLGRNIYMYICISISKPRVKYGFYIYLLYLSRVYKPQIYSGIRQTIFSIGRAGPDTYTYFVLPLATWPLQDIVSPQSFIGGTTHSFTSPPPPHTPICNAYPIAIRDNYKRLFYPRSQSCGHGPIVLSFFRLACNAYPIAIRLHDHCAIYAPPPIPPLYAIHHAILVVAISCKGQLARLRAFSSLFSLFLGLYIIFVPFQSFCLHITTIICKHYTYVQIGIE